MNIIDSSLWIEYFLENDIDQSVIDATTLLCNAELYTQGKILFSKTFGKDHQGFFCNITIDKRIV